MKPDPIEITWGDRGYTLTYRPLYGDWKGIKSMTREKGSLSDVPEALSKIIAKHFTPPPESTRCRYCEYVPGKENRDEEGPRKMYRCIHGHKVCEDCVKTVGELDRDEVDEHWRRLDGNPVNDDYNRRNTEALARPIRCKDCFVYVKDKNRKRRERRRP